MSATVDVNVLLHASDSDTAEHAAAQGLIQRLVAGPALTTLFWPVLLSYLRIATNPRVYDRPHSPADTVKVVDGLLAASTVRVVGEDANTWSVYKHLDIGQPIRGDLVPDAVIVAMMLSNGVSTIYTRDRGFRRFDGIKVVDPFAAVE